MFRILNNYKGEYISFEWLNTAVTTFINWLILALLRERLLNVMCLLIWWSIPNITYTCQNIKPKSSYEEALWKIWNAWHSTMKLTEASEKNLNDTESRKGGRHVLDQYFFSFSKHQSYLECLLQNRFLVLLPKFSPRHGSKIFISDKFPSNPTTASLGVTMRTSRRY